VCGGQGHELFEKTKCFINSFSKAGIDLVFVCDGDSPGINFLKKFLRFFVCVKTKKVDHFLNYENILAVIYELAFWSLRQKLHRNVFIKLIPEWKLDTRYVNGK